MRTPSFVRRTAINTPKSDRIATKEGVIFWTPSKKSPFRSPSEGSLKGSCGFFFHVAFLKKPHLYEPLKGCEGDVEVTRRPGVTPSEGHLKGHGPGVSGCAVTPSEGDLKGHDPGSSAGPSEGSLKGFFKTLQPPSLCHPMALLWGLEELLTVPSAAHKCPIRWPKEGPLGPKKSLSVPLLMWYGEAFLDPI